MGLMRIPTRFVDTVGSSIIHHSIDSNSPLRGMGYVSQGELFVKVDSGRPLAGGYFWLNDSMEWDIHLYTFDAYRRHGLATALFRDGILPWLRCHYGGERICTTIIASESIALLGKLGFMCSNGCYNFVIPPLNNE